MKNFHEDGETVQEAVEINKNIGVEVWELHEF